MNVWYNTYRPQKFEEVLGQELVVRVLSNAIKTDRIKNGYLLSGSRGVGKTTLARIFANELNSTASKPEAKIDIFEMDAASNTSVDDIRLLIENASTPPLVGKYKIFIIDEVHMLSKSAMNALLKILEEPPVYLLFIFATTNPEKVIPTVLSRLIKLELIDHSIEDLILNMKSIAGKEDINITDSALTMIAKKANGGQRDAINYLQTVAEYGLESYTDVEIAQILGVMPSELLDAVIYTIKSDSVTVEYKKRLIANLAKLQISPLDSINQVLSYLLDEHFNGNTLNSDLIPVLGLYINSNLPVSTTIEVLAYLDYNYPTKLKIPEVVLKEVQGLNLETNEKKTKKIVQKAEPIIEPIIESIAEPVVEIVPIIEESIPEPIALEDNIQTDQVPDEYEFDINDYESFMNPQEEIEPVIAEPEPVIEKSVEVDTTESIDLTMYNKIVSNLAKDKKANATLISMVKFLSVESRSGELWLVNSNKELQNLITVEMIEFLNAKFDSLISGKHSLKFDLVKQPVLKTQKTNSINSSGDSKEHFYKIYGSRPENVPTSIELIDDIPDPIKSASLSEPIDDGQIEDLFDI
jgi:DNA polymerase III subunit gamma/tau